MMNCLDFVEIREAEEQIEILEKIVPDWLCKKVVSSGDTMYVSRMCQIWTQFD